MLLRAPPEHHSTRKPALTTKKSGFGSQNRAVLVLPVCYQNGGIGFSQQTG